MKVKDCMCNNVIYVKPETNVQDVVNLMNQNHIGSVPVCDNNNCICGIVTDRDILLRCVACEKEPKTTPISDIMTCNVCTCTQDEDITSAQMKMQQKQIRRLPVLDNNNNVIGILTLGNLARNDDKIGKEQVCTTIENICCNQKSQNAN